MSDFRCGFCGLQCLNEESFKAHLLAEHPQSNVNVVQDEGFRFVPMFGPALNPVSMIAHGDNPTCSMDAVAGMKLGFEMLMGSRQILDDWYLLAIFRENDIPEELALNMLRSLRARRSGKAEEGTDPSTNGAG